MNNLGTDFEHPLNISDETENSDEIGSSSQQRARRYANILKAKADILKAPDRYMFVLDMPGLESRNIKVKVENNVLHIEGKKKNRLSSEIKVMRMERPRASYKRNFVLPWDSNVQDRKNRKAAYKDGVLTVTMARRRISDTEKLKSITIPVS